MSPQSAPPRSGDDSHAPAPPAASGVRARLRTFVTGLHVDETDPVGVPLTPDEKGRLRAVRRFGATGTVLMAVAALGAGAGPVVQNPVYGQRLWGLPARMPSVSLTVAFTGALMLVGAWLMLGRYALGRRGADGRTRRLSRTGFDRTLLLWTLPLLVVPPMYSKDVYSYLAQSEIAARGMDPYELGPAQALGIDHTLTRTVPNIWRETPAPYEPLFLWIGKLIGAVTGENIIAGVLVHRAVEIVGLVLIVWALPRLARRCRVAPVAALWLGAANPLVLLHLVAGVHNEALMMGLMTAGLELSLRALDAAGPLSARAWLLFAVGSGLIVLSSAIKIPTLLALGFTGLALARRLGGRLITVIAVAAALATLTVAITVAVAFGTGLGFGWLDTLGTAGEVRSWLSLPTLAGLAAGGIGILLGLGDHISAVLTLTHALGLAVMAAVSLRMLLWVHQGRIDPVGGLGISMALLVLLFPVAHPWYLVWALVPLAAWASRPIILRPAIAISAVISLVGPMPNGAAYPPFMIVQAATVVVIAALAILWTTRNRLPWRSAVAWDDHAAPQTPTVVHRD